MCGKIGENPVAEGPFPEKNFIALYLLTVFVVEYDILKSNEN